MAVYLDHAAAEPVLPEVLNELRGNAEMFYNPSSINKLSRCNLRSIEATRDRIAELIGCEPTEIYSTSGASESNSWAIDGFLKSYKNSIVISTNIEHSSILNNPNVHPLIKANENGFLLEEAIKATEPEWAENTLLVISHANNEIGTIQNIKQLKQACPDCFLLVDAAQTFMKIPINVKEMGIDMMSVSAGKIGGIRGTGFLYVSKDMSIKPIIYGTQEQGKRGGTYFDLGIRCLYTALFHEYDGFSVGLKRNFLLQELNTIPEVQLVGTVENRLPNNALIKISNLEINSQQLVAMLEEKGFIVSSGSACHAGSPELSHVLQAIGETIETAPCVLRITIGENTDVNDLYEFVRTLKGIVAMFHV